MGVFLGFAGRFGLALIDPQPVPVEGLGVGSGAPGEDRHSGGCDIRNQAGDCAEDDCPDAGCGAPRLGAGRCGLRSDFELRSMLEDREQAYVLAVRTNHSLRFSGSAGMVETNPKAVVDGLEDNAWSAHTACAGTDVLRLRDWARFALPWDCKAGRGRRLLIRRSRRDPEKQACCLAFCPAGTTFANWPVPPASAGPSRNAARGPRTISASITARPPVLARLAPANEPGQGRRRIPCQSGRGSAPRALKQTEQDESKVSDYFSPCFRCFAECTIFRLPDLDLRSVS